MTPDTPKLLALADEVLADYAQYPFRGEPVREERLAILVKSVLTATPDARVEEIRKRQRERRLEYRFEPEADSESADLEYLLSLLSTGAATAPAPALSPLTWRNMLSAPKDVPIIYWHARRYVSSCEWCEPDEGVEGGWWDDANTEYVEPVAWFSVLPPTEGLSA
jgi:hypothetical protein